MLTGALGRTLSLLAVAAAFVVAISFVFFAVDELGGASREQQHRTIDADVTPGELAEDNRESRHAQPRESIDDVNDFLLAPFQDVVTSDDAWAMRIVPTLLGLILYGIGLGYLARWVSAGRD
jgi:hypothetical protein